jgi:hypothetical protein
MAKSVAKTMIARAASPRASLTIDPGRTLVGAIGPWDARVSICVMD